MAKHELQHEKTKEWVASLTPEQAKQVLLELIGLAYQSKNVRFGDLAPYWEATGDPLVEGQKIWTDED